MTIYYPDILQERTAARQFSYSAKDVILYALGVGMGRDPLDEGEVAFVYEESLKVLPTAITVLTPQLAPAPNNASLPPGHRQSQLNFLMVVHGEQKVELHKPLPSRGSFTAEGRTIGAFDKGASKGAVVISETVWRDADGEKAATLTSSTFARGDGGFGGPSDGAPEPHAVPSRAPDVSVDMITRPDQALLYRLNGDLNPLHIDPRVAKAAGYPRPILHGLCTYGITCRAVLQVFGIEPDRILSHQVRFSAPVFPGETITVDLWRDGNEISIEAHVKARAVTVIKNGLTVLG